MKPANDTGLGYCLCAHLRPENDGLPVLWLVASGRGTFVDIDETIVADGASAARAITEPYSAEWWQERSTTELRDIIKRGFSLGPAYDGAVVETERRAREALRRIRDDNAV